MLMFIVFRHFILSALVKCLMKHVDISLPKKSHFFPYAIVSFVELWNRVKCFFFTHSSLHSHRFFLFTAGGSKNFAQFGDASRSSHSP